MYISGKELIKKWKAIRDNFVKDYKLITRTETGQPATKKKRYVYYDQLQFLIRHIRGNENTCSNIEPPTGGDVDSEEPNETQNQSIIEDAEKEPNQTKTEILPNTSAQNSTSKVVAPIKINHAKQTRVSKKAKTEISGVSVATDLTSILSESLAFQKEEREKDIYGHKAFLLSFVPVLNSLPLHVAMQARLKITQLINEVYLQSRVGSTDSFTSEYSGNVSSAPPTPASIAVDNDSSQDFNISHYINLY